MRQSTRFRTHRGTLRARCALPLIAALATGCGQGGGGADTGTAANAPAAAQVASIDQGAVVKATFVETAEPWSDAYLADWTSADEALALAQAFDVTVRRFVHARYGPREPTDPSAVPDAIAALAGGQCDSAVEAFRRLAGEYGANATVRNLNFNTPDPIMGLRGHTVAAVFLDGRWIVFDPTYGIVADTRRAQVDDDLYRAPERRVWSHPAMHLAHPLSPEVAAAVYAGVTDERFSAAFDGEPGLAARTPWLGHGDQRVGSVDARGDDVVAALGSHFDYLGTYLTPIRHEWRFDGLDAGATYRLRFVLRGTFRATPVLTVAVTGRDGDPLAAGSPHKPADTGPFEVAFTAGGSRAVVAISGEAAYEAVFVDAVELLGDGPS